MSRFAGALVTLALAKGELAQHCQRSSIGKCLPNAFYIHRSAVAALDDRLQAVEQSVRGLLNQVLPFTLVKFHFDQPKLSYLYYPDFDTEPHPLLRTITIVDWATGTVDNGDSAMPPTRHCFTAKKHLLPLTIPTTAALPI